MEVLAFCSWTEAALDQLAVMTVEDLYSIVVSPVDIDTLVVSSIPPSAKPAAPVPRGCTVCPFWTAGHNLGLCAVDGNSWCR